MLEGIAKEKVKGGKEKEAIELYEIIHLNSIKFEEKVFRKDYVLNLLRILIEQNEYIVALKTLGRELEFIQSTEISIGNWNLYMMDTLLIYMIIHNEGEIKKMIQSLSERDFFMSKEGQIFEELFEYYKEGNKEEWMNFLSSTKTYSIVPTNVT